MTARLAAIGCHCTRAARLGSCMIRGLYLQKQVRALATVDTTSAKTSSIPPGSGPKSSFRPLRSWSAESCHPVPKVIAAKSNLSPKIENGILYVPTQSGWTKASGRWLRDICSSPQSRNQDTSQRQINVFKLGKSCGVSTVSQIGDSFQVTFADGHQSLYSIASLMDRSDASLKQKRAGVIPITTWTASIDSQPPTVDYASVSSASGMAELMTNLRTYGFSFADKMPATPETSEQFLESIGPIRNTHYGGFYDFTSDLSSKDTAYTSESLEPHTDNTYFTEPAGLQALHMLSHTDGTGGESSLVDGIGAAEQLYEQDREAYKILSETGVYAHASGNEGISIQPAYAFPTLNHDTELGHLMQVRWNNADRAGIVAEHDELDKWYDAAVKFDALLCDPKNVYWFQLKPGKMLIFDNWRVLHGRAAFTGKRRMCGAYINRDDYISKFRISTMSEEDVRGSTVTG